MECVDDDVVGCTTDRVLIYVVAAHTTMGPASPA